MLVFLKMEDIQLIAYLLPHVHTYCKTESQWRTCRFLAIRYRWRYKE